MGGKPWGLHHAVPVGSNCCKLVASDTRQAAGSKTVAVAVGWVVMAYYCHLRCDDDTGGEEDDEVDELESLNKIL